MERIRVSSLKPGQTFSKSLFSPTGQKLLNQGVVLSNRHIEAIQRGGDLEVLAAVTIEELIEAGLIERFDRSRLAVGQKPGRSLLAKSGQVIVEADQEVESHHLDALEAGGATFVSKKEATTQRRERILMCDELLEELLGRSSELQLRIEPDAGGSWLKPAAGSGPLPLEKLTASRAAAVDTLRRCYAQIEAGNSVAAATFDPILDELLNHLAAFPRSFTQLALLSARREEYLPDHAYTVTVLAMAIAAQLRWSKRDVRRVGLAGLLFDLGMLLVPERIRTGACELTDIDRSRVQRHPIFALSMLQCLDNVEPTIALAAVQHHERENGTGYPRYTRGNQNCDLARVLAVADTFAAATESRHYRQNKLPYIAMEESLRAASSIQIWKSAVRGLIQAAGLFPVGSFVKLSDGVNAQVVASHPTSLNRPTVQPLETDGRPKGDPIDLASVPESKLTIVRPLAGATG